MRRVLIVTLVTAVLCCLSFSCGEQHASRQQGADANVLERVLREDAYDQIVDTVVFWMTPRFSHPDPQPMAGS